MPLVKICGITNQADALAACAAGADALGFNFYPRSPRYIEPDAAHEIIARLPSSVLTVGVFVNAGAPEELARLATRAGVAAVQLHGDETPAYCAALAEWQVIKALRVGPEFTPEQATCYPAHAILLDAYSAHAHGGTGQVFDWAHARRTRELVPRLFLAGGLTPENVVAAVAAVEPYAIDVCSGVESMPGRKDLAKLRAFMEAARAAAEKLMSRQSTDSALPNASREMT
jgi:phosphoribosylanthranilate isomerase